MCINLLCGRLTRWGKVEGRAVCFNIADLDGYHRKFAIPAEAIEAFRKSPDTYDGSAVATP